MWKSVYLIVGAFMIVSCTNLPKLPAKGMVSGQDIAVDVDSKIAKYYLERNQSGNVDTSLEQEIKGILERHDGSALNWKTIKSVSSETSADFAALYFAHRLSMDSESARFQREFKKQFECLKTSCPELKDLRSFYSKYRVLVVGGLHYKSDTTTGADLAGPRKLLGSRGYDVELLDLDEDGIVEENAVAIAAAIRSQPADKGIILVSASKGGLDVAYALGKLLTPKESEKVKGWVSIGGILRGTFLADNALRIPKWWFAKIALWAIGVDSKCVKGMTTEESRKRIETLKFPDHILKISYIGAPLSGQLAKDVKGRYMELREHGPSDGLTLLPDAIIPGSKTILEWGLDHYFRDPEIDLKALALANLIIKELNGREKSF